MPHTTSLFGLEAELALCTTTRGAPVPSAVAVSALAQAAERRLVHLRGHGSRLYLANGSLFYVDVGCHPEVATPECTTPWEAVAHLRAAELMVADLAAPLREALGVDEVLVGRGNVDYLAGTTWGCHESYLARMAVGRYQEWLVPHLVSRALYTGSGGLDPTSPGIRFSTSPRVAHISHVVSAESTSRRGIFHTRDEALAKGYKRLHVLAGDNACSQLATLLKVGATALVVALTELGEPAPLKLKQPVPAMKGFARDQAYLAEVELDNQTRSMSALDIQHHYLAAIEAHANSPRLPEWAERLCVIWRRALELLGQPERAACSHAFDWTLKRALFGRELERAGLDWESVAAWSGVLETLKARWPVIADSPGPILWFDRARIEQLLGVHPAASTLVNIARRSLCVKGLNWDGLDAFNALRQRLCAIEVRFGEIGSGIFDTLDRQGALPDHRVVTETDIAAAAGAAPAGTRAAIRGEWIRRLDAQRNHYSCAWEAIHGIDNSLDLSDPFTTAAAWRKAWVA